MTDIRIGIIGHGNMGSAHARNLHEGKVPGARLAALADINPEALRGYDDSVATFASADELLAARCVDAVIIATPHYDHTPISVQALEAGLHVLVEKPLGVHVADCRKTIAAYENRPDKNQIFCLMFNQRTTPTYQKLRDLISKGELGALQRVQWTITDWFRSQAYYDSGGWRATWGGEGGGVLLNQCPHQLDLWQWLFGMPDRVRAFCHFGKRHSIEVEDEVTAYLEYDAGYSGVFIAATGESPGTNRLEIACERGRVVLENGELRWTRTEQEVSAFSHSTRQAFAKAPHWEVLVPTSGTGEGHVGIMKNFIAAITGEAELMAPGLQGIRSVELANAMLLSGFTGETVPLPIDAAAYEAQLQERIASSTFVKPEAIKTSADDFQSSF
ncbi:MAG: Gfo/Idh/MocA family protein [Planctomycetota bacterium]